MRRATPTTARQPTGFTLMELLVALVVSLILVIIIYSVYSRGAKTYRVQNMSLQMQAQARGVIVHL